MNKNTTGLTVRVNSYDLSSPPKDMVEVTVACESFIHFFRSRDLLLIRIASPCSTPPPPTDVIIHPNFTEVTYNAERRFDIALLRFQDSVDDIPSLK